MWKRWERITVRCVLVLGILAGIGVIIAVRRDKAPTEETDTPAPAPASPSASEPPFPADAPDKTATAHPKPDKPDAPPTGPKDIPANILKWAEACDQEELLEIRHKRTQRIDSELRVIKMLEEAGYEDKAAARRKTVDELKLKFRAVQHYIEKRGDGRPIPFPW